MEFNEDNEFKVEGENIEADSVKEAELNSEAVEAGSPAGADVIPENEESDGAAAADGNIQGAEPDSLSNGEILMSQPDSQHKSKKPVFIALALVGVAAIAAIIAMMLGLNPARALAKAQKATAKDYNKVIENALFSYDQQYVELTPKTEADFSVTLKNISSMSGLPLFFLNGSTLSGGVVTDEEAKKLDGRLELVMADESIANLNINLDDTYLSVNVPELFGDKYLSFNLETINEDAKQSSAGYYFGLPVYDYASIARQMFNLTSNINELNRINASFAENSADAVEPVFEPSPKESAKNLEVVSGEAGEVNGINCKTYSVSYPEELVQDGYREFADSFLESYELSFNENMELIKKIFPILDEQAIEQMQSPTEELREALYKLSFSGPVEALYYVDGKNKIRRSVYTAVIRYEDETYDIILDTSKNGEVNVYDSLEIKLTVAAADNTIVLEVLSEGEHSSTDIFTDNSRINFSFTNGITGEPGEASVNSTLRFDPALNETTMDIELTAPEMPGKMLIGFTAKNETDEQAKTSKTTYDNIYFELPELSASLGMSYSVGPAAESAGSRDSLEHVELFKMDEEELMTLFTEIDTNYEILMQRVLGLFGF